MFGNSYTCNGSEADGWWHKGSMAASRLEKSWWYQLADRLDVYGIGKNAYNYDMWEQKLDNSTLSGLDNDINGYDMIILQVGANASSSDSTTYKTALRNLINNHIKIVCPNAILVFTNMAAGNHSTDNYTVCNEFNGIFVDVSSIPLTYPTMDTIIYDENGVGHTISSGKIPSGYVAHPNDEYYDKVTEIFYELLK